jgi:hypothetical protein
MYKQMPIAVAGECANVQLTRVHSVQDWLQVMALHSARMQAHPGPPCQLSTI